MQTSAAAGAEPVSAQGVAIRVRNVSKHYLMFGRPEDRLKQSIMPRLQRLLGQPVRRYYRDFAALNDVSFEVRRGETVGIVGRNGSGKSTLLQIICGTLQPSGGGIEVNGRIAALLELGAGFNPAFTGRENVYLKAAILGLSRAEIDARFDSIVRFADIGAFIDQPVNTYSSGMYVRLAFATAINVDPDILVVDEALAVGDEAFQRKCFARIEAIQEAGATILFVSHAAQSVVQLCSRAILIDAGELLLDGRPKVVVSQYQRLVHLSPETSTAVREQIRELNRSGAAEPNPKAEPAQPKPVEPAAIFDPSLVPQSTVAYESKGARIRDLMILTPAGEQVNVLQMGKSYIYQYLVDFLETSEQVGFGMLIRSASGLELAGATTSRGRQWRIPQVTAGQTYQIKFRFECALLPGTYFLNAGVSGRTREAHQYLHRLLDGLMFRVAPQPDLTATGWFDLHIAPQVQAVDEVRPAVARA